MLDMLITSRTRRKLLGFFVLNPDGHFYLHQLAGETDESAQAIRTELAVLVKAGFVISIGAGRKRHYMLNSGYAYLSEIRSIVKKLKSAGNPEFNFTDHPRKALLEKNLRVFIQELISKYRPEKIILFGSMVKGKISETTDIDMLIVKDTHKPYYDRVREVIALCEYDVGIDFLVYNPDELKEMARDNPFVRDEIIKKGEVLYDKAA